MEQTLLEVSHLSFSYEDQDVLKDISVKIKRGEKIAVMGSNGAGKSTFFLNLNGVLQAKKGEIFLEGEKIQKKNFIKLYEKVGFVFQDADSQMIASNVRAEISFGPMNLGLPKDEVRQRVQDAASYLSLENMLDRAPHYLSGGEKKRVSIADILAMKPELLIFDEPMAALDPVNGEKVEEILNRLGKEGKTLMVATHDVDFAYRFADRILVFGDGRIIAEGTPMDIFHREDILDIAHLKKPSVMVIWEGLIDQKMVDPKKPYPLTPKEVVQRLQ